MLMRESRRRRDRTSALSVVLMPQLPDPSAQPRGEDDDAKEAEGVARQQAERDQGDTGRDHDWVDRSVHHSTSAHRYTIENTATHTPSTKCQYSATEATAGLSRRQPPPKAKPASTTSPISPINTCS